MHALLALLIAVGPLPVIDGRVGGTIGPEAAESLPEDPAQRAGVLFEAGRFAEAAVAFEEAYQATGDAVFLFGRAQALRRAGNCGAAIDVLQAFIDTTPPESDVAEAQRVIDACREVLGEPEPEPEPEPDPDPEPDLDPIPPGDEQPEPEKRPRPAWARDVAGGVLVGTGAFATVAGVGFYAGSFSMARDREESEADFEGRAQRVRNTAAVGITLMAVGGALVVGGIVRYAIVARRAKTSARLGAPLVWRF